MSIEIGVSMKKNNLVDLSLNIKWKVSVIYGMNQNIKKHKNSGPLFKSSSKSLYASHSGCNSKYKLFGIT